MIPFWVKEYDELFLQTVAYAQEHEIISSSIDFLSLIKENKDIENFTVLTFSVLAKLYDEVYKDMDKVKKGFNVLEATGTDLDNIGVYKGIRRPMATSCTAELNFIFDNPLTQTVTIKHGIIVSTKDGINYMTENITRTLPVGSVGFTAIAFAEETGPNQRVSQDTLTIITSDLPSEIGKCRVTNPYPATGGTETATDDEYREYLINSDKIHEKGTFWAYKNYLSRYSGLDSYNLVPQWDGTGTMKIIIDAPDETQYHINKITSEVQESVAWADDDVTVVPATQIPIAINIVCNIDIDQINPHSTLEKDEVQARLVKAVLVYVNGGKKENGDICKGLVIGEDFIPYQLGVFLANEVNIVKNIEISNPTTPITVKDDEIAYLDSKDVYITME